MSRKSSLRIRFVFVSIFLLAVIIVGCGKKADDTGGASQTPEVTVETDNGDKESETENDDGGDDGIEREKIDLTALVSPAVYQTGLYTKNTLSQNAPAIIKISEGVGPGDAVSVYGEYLTGDLLVSLVEAGLEIEPVQTDPEGQFLRFIYPEDLAPGVYTLKVSNDGGKSWSAQERVLNGPDGQWASDEGTYTGMLL